MRRVTPFPKLRNTFNMKKRARDINIGDTVKFEVVTAIEITPRGKYVFKSERCYQSGGIMGAGINPEQWVSLNNFEFLDALEGTEISKGGYDEEYNSYLYRIF